jgi:phosphoenolpyruvate carboxykinase (ATP)
VDEELKPRDLVKKLYDYPNVQHLSDEEAKRRASIFAQRTEFGSLNFVSSVRNRSAGLTVYMGSKEVRQTSLSPRQRQIVEQAPETLAKVARHLERVPIVSIRRTMGDNPDFNPHCTLFISSYAGYPVQIAYMWGETLMAHRPQAPGPELSLIYVPEWPEHQRQILVYPEENVTLVLGSDYMGESKKGFLRKAMWRAKLEGMLGVHAGSKTVVAADPEGKPRRYAKLLFGLSATGKTTHSCHDHGLDQPGEKVEIVQDDVCFLRLDGSALGTERGFYLKTEGLHPVTQPLLYRAATQPRTMFENVMVDHQGQVDFDDETLTSNGRGVVQMSDLAPRASSSINLPPVSELDGLILIFITRRNTILPICSKLNPEQAALAFMLGESVESSAGDPTKAGESVRVVGTNPFIIGDEAKEGVWFYEFIKRHEQKVQAYLINTGGVGEARERLPSGGWRINRPVARVQILETASVFRSILRNTVKWRDCPYFGVRVPAELDGFDITRYDPEKFYSHTELERLSQELKRERHEYIEQFHGLDRAIIAATGI